MGNKNMNEECGVFGTVLITSSIVGVIKGITSKKKTPEGKILDGLSEGKRFFEKHNGYEHGAKCLTGKKDKNCYC